MTPTTGPTQPFALAIDATNKLLDQANDVTNAETGEYFKNVQAPAVK